MAMHDNAIAFMVHLCCEAAKNIYAVYCWKPSTQCARSGSTADHLTRHIVSRCGAGSSVHPAASNNPPRRDNNSTGNRPPGDDSGTAGGDAACTNHAASADDGACFHGAQGEEASRQQ